MDDSGRLLSWLTEIAKIDWGPEAGAAQLGSLALRAIAAAGLKTKDAKGLGLALPGTMDGAAVGLANSAVLPGWERFPLRDCVSGHCGLPATLVNDAVAAAYAERWVGAGQRFQSIVVLILGKGDRRGNPHRRFGDRWPRWPGEPVRPHPHRRHRRGAAVQLRTAGSPRGLRRRDGPGRVDARIPGRRPHQCAFSARVAAGEPLTGKLVAAAAESGDVLATELVLDSARALAVGVVSMMHTIDPGAVLLGGEMTFGGAGSELGRRFLAQVRQQVQRLAFPVLARSTVIDFAALGEEAGVIGAAGLREGRVRAFPPIVEFVLKSAAPTPQGNRESPR